MPNRSWFPLDHLLLPQSRVFPAVVVVKLPNGFTHFLVVWRRFGRYLQVMDPASGRQWLTEESFLSRVYVHQHRVSAADWREYAGTEDFLSALRRRARVLHIPRDVRSRAIAGALDDASWRSIAALDAALRMIHPIATGARLRGLACGNLLEQLLEKTRQSGENIYAAIPNAYWSVLTDASEAESAEEQQLVFRGAVLVKAAAGGACSLKQAKWMKHRLRLPLPINCVFRPHLPSGSLCDSCAPTDC